jgi:hypothetical protein
MKEFFLHNSDTDQDYTFSSCAESSSSSSSSTDEESAKANKEEESIETDTQQTGSKQKLNPSKLRKDVTNHLRNCGQANMSAPKVKY